MICYSNDSFITAARAVHGDRYGYSSTRYVNSYTQVTIVCPEHGPFQQRPDKHLLGHGCRKCGDELRAKRQAQPIDEFIEGARRLHGDRYDYTRVNYVNRTTKVLLCCAIHGEFAQTPQHHLRGSGCPRCAIASAAAKQTYTTSEFTRDARAKHGKRYDYSLVSYRHSHLPVSIVCRVHGVFSQAPRKHLEGSGCHRCAALQRGSKCRRTQLDFLQRAGAIHGSRYDYSAVQYQGMLTAVPIICPDHGQFMQTPNTHLAGKGCPACGLVSRGLKRRKSLAEFIAAATLIHGDRYGYASSDYHGYQTEVTIICGRHGAFEQTPSTHLAGKGCPRCGVESSASLQTMSTEEFVRRGTDKFPGRYDYSLVLYEHSQAKVRIKCCIHNLVFSITPGSHLGGGGGCRRCAADATAERFRSTREEFLSAAKKIHGNRYGYDSVVYTHCNNTVVITCEFHGPFEQTPSAHLSGCGCRKCNLLGGLNERLFEEYPEKKKLAAVLYLLRMTDGVEAFLKIGVTTRSVKQRYSYKHWYQHLQIQELETVQGSLYEVWTAEQAIKLRFRKSAFSPTTRFAGDTECFRLSALSAIREYLNLVSRPLVGLQH